MHSDQHVLENNRSAISRSHPDNFFALQAQVNHIFRMRVDVAGWYHDSRPQSDLPAWASEYYTRGSFHVP
jgi:hypothetical protein